MNYGVIWEPRASAANYRAIHPAMALQRMGHRSAPLASPPGSADFSLLSKCDAVLIYRRYDVETREVLRRLRDRGVGIVYDNDDDYTLIPEDHPRWDELQGAFEDTLETARLADVMTATTDAVAARYSRHGISRLRVIPNYVGLGAEAPRRDHDGVVIGWVAGLEHRQDARALRLGDTLRELLAAHADLKVECLGVDLALPERYSHASFVGFTQLPSVIGGFDVGIAPLADLPMNWTRSDIKIKEYAACGVPWVASPIGPYLELGEDQGGRLAEDDKWFDVLDRLIRKGRERRKLAAKARAWGRRQTLARSIRDWESALVEAWELAQAR